MSEVDAAELAGAIVATAFAIIGFFLGKSYGRFVEAKSRDDRTANVVFRGPVGPF